MIKVCLASERFFPVYGGPLVRFRRYLPGFRDRGLDLRVFTATPTRPAGETSRPAHGERASLGQESSIDPVDGVPVRRVRIPDRGASRRARWFSSALVRYCQRPETRPDVIQFLTLSPSYLPALVRLRRMGVPTVHVSTMLLDFKGPPAKQWVAGQYAALPYRQVAHIVVSSSTMARYWRGLGVTTPTTIIPNGVDTGRFRPPESEEERLSARRGLGIPDAAPVLAWVGPVNVRKGADVLLEAWTRLCARHPELHLVVVGPRDTDDREFQGRIDRLVAESGAADRVHLLGLVQDVERYLQAADIFVFTSRREGMPNGVLEAMACGLPVVMTPFIGLPEEFGQSGKEHLLTSYDPDRVADDVGALLRDPERARALGKAGLQLVRDTMQVESSLDRFADVYRALANGAVSGPA